MTTPTPSIPRTHLVASAFRDEIDRIRALFFSRDPACWPVFSDPVFSEIVNFRKHHMPLRERVQQFPDGEGLLRQVREQKCLPPGVRDPRHGVDPILVFAAALSKNWEDPASVENVITSPSDPALFGSMVGILANANLVHPEYSEMAGELESLGISQMASLAGYDPARATGVFTQGGTFCNLYGYLLGLRKSLPQSREFGLETGHDYRIINSSVGHYSNMTNLSLLGVNIRRKTIRIRATENNDMDLDDLERQAGPGEGNEPFPFDCRQCGIVGAGEADDLKLALAGMNCRPIIVTRDDVDFTDRQFLDDLVQLPSRDRDPSRLFYGRLVVPAHTDFEVGGDDLHSLLLRLNQDVREDRHCVALLDNTLDPLKTRQELNSSHTQFHDLFPLAQPLTLVGSAPSSCPMWRSTHCRYLSP